MDFDITADGVSALADSITALAAAAAAFQGIRSLNAWRKEALGRRRFEVAEDVLASFYRAQEILSFVRSPFISAGELTDEEGVDKSLTSNSDYVPLRRLHDQAEFFTSLRAKKQIFAALFGKENVGPFDEINRILNEIQTGVEMLVWFRKGGVPKRTEPDHETYLAARRTVTRPLKDADDQIAPRIAKAVEEIERLCTPEIQSRMKKSRLRFW